MAKSDATKEPRGARPARVLVRHRCGGYGTKRCKGRDEEGGWKIGQRGRKNDEKDNVVLDQEPFGEDHLSAINHKVINSLTRAHALSLQGTFFFALVG